MPLTRRSFLQQFLVPPAAAVQAQLPSSDRDYHLLRRITWGPRPHDVARMRQIGRAAFLAEQLNPETLDDSHADELLKAEPIVSMSRGDLYVINQDYGRVYDAHQRAIVQRAVHSRRQLLERMVDFWRDHFNIPAESVEFPELLLFEREVLRPHALGNFRDLLLATAKSPALLVYLDNAYSSQEHPNENYARELLELHTLGVDGGYSEEDVKMVARAFTGWSLHDGTPDGFFFNHWMHDAESKTILGHQLPDGRGIEDGLHVVSILANHPATARYVSAKLCVRFVSDRPPATLIESTTRVWQRTDGDIRQVVGHILTSSEFEAAVGEKYQRPFEFFIGALRATGTQIRRAYVQEELLYQLGQWPYGWPAPNGYPDVAGAWINTSGLLSRWNTAMRLTHAAYSAWDAWDNNMTTELAERIGQPQRVDALVDAVAEQVFGLPLEPDARAPFLEYASDGGRVTAVTPLLLSRKLASLYGLMLASPIYQWR